MIEVLPPRQVGPNMSYTIQVALDGVNFIDVVTVKLNIDNKDIQTEDGFKYTGIDDIRNVVVKHVDEHGKQIAEDDIYRGYSISMIRGLGITPKDIPNYELIGMKENVDWENAVIYNGKTYTYEYRKVYVEEIPELPKAPASVKAVLSGGHNHVKFSWSKVNEADGYFVFYKKASAEKWSEAVSTTALSYVKKNLAANIKYDFKVVPYKLVDGQKLYDNTQFKAVSITTKKNVKAPAAVKAVLSGGYDDVKVSWSKVTGAAGYYVSMKKDGASAYTNLGTTTKLSYVKKNLADGVKYTFKVVPYYKNGTVKVQSFYSKAASVTTLKKLAAPKLTKVSAKKVKVSWINIAGETGYQISRSTKKTGTNIISTYATTTGKTKTLTVEKNKKYFYKVRAYKTVDGKKIYGPWSDVK